MFGIGPTELFLVAVIGLMTIGIPIGLVILLIIVLLMQKRGHETPNLIDELRAENQRLRDELAALKEPRQE